MIIITYYYTHTQKNTFLYFSPHPTRQRLSSQYDRKTKNPTFLEKFENVMSWLCLLVSLWDCGAKSFYVLTNCFFCLVGFHCAHCAYICKYLTLCSKKLVESKKKKKTVRQNKKRF